MSASNARRPYKRPMGGWWKKNPYFVEYMVHEGTALFVAAYALLLHKFWIGKYMLTAALESSLA